MDVEQVISVSELNAYLKGLMERDPRLAKLKVRGEISNMYRHPTSGHMYFTLKDEESCLSCVFFRGRNRHVTFEPEDGMQVLAYGHVGLYEKAGKYQLYIDDLLPDGLGALFVAYEQLKNRLEDEGLFDADHKRELPLLPNSVGVVTAPAGAAVRDVLSVIKRRYPHVRIIISPATVQGENAPSSLRRALRRLGECGEELDVIVIARGGGSWESLWCFNDEELARSIHACPVPVVSAVGHETDFTICDYVADHRAPTPSAAAEMVVPEYAELNNRLTELEERLANGLSGRMRTAQRRLNDLKRAPVLTRPLAVTEQYLQRVDELHRSLLLQMKRILDTGSQRFHGLVDQLDTLSPLKTLKRGYALVQKDGKVVFERRQVSCGDRLSVRVRDGCFHCRVIDDGKEESDERRAAGC